MALPPEYKPQPLLPEDEQRPASKIFGATFLKLRRSIDGHRIEDFAARLGIKGFDVAQIESSRVAVPPLAIISQWSTILDLKPEQANQLQVDANVSGHEDPNMRNLFDAGVQLIYRK